MGKTLEHLPFELLAHIISYIDTARALLHLSLTCKQLHDFIERNGFRIFVQCRFPSLQVPPFWKDAALALTTLSRNWDRKAFVARYLVPDGNSTWFSREIVTTGKHVRQSTEGRHFLHGFHGSHTKGFRPYIDSYEEWIGDSWASRKQVLVCAAGPELVLRSKALGNVDLKGRTEDRLDQHGHLSTWATSHDGSSKAERDDIVSVYLLRPTQRPANDFEYVVIGRASGALTLIMVSVSTSKAFPTKKYNTGRQLIAHTAVNDTSNPLLAVCLYDNTLALYSIHSQDQVANPCAKTKIGLPWKLGEFWKCHFLRRDRLAVGVAPLPQAIHVYDIQRHGISDHPVARLGMGFHGSEAFEAFSEPGYITSVGPIVTVPPCCATGGVQGEIFLSGAQDGNVRLHDLRCPTVPVAVFTDPADPFCSIYSLLSFGNERFIAGDSRSSMVKVYDLRMACGKPYQATKIDPRPLDTYPTLPYNFSSPTAARCYKYMTSNFPLQHRCKYHLYCDNDHKSSNPLLQRRYSPIFSLSSPSPSSPTFFAGVRGEIIQCDVVSVMDDHPDPIFRNGLKCAGTQADAEAKWDPHHDSFRMTLVELQESRCRVTAQNSIRFAYGRQEGWDERWE